MQGGSGAHDRLPDFLGDTRDQRSYAHWCALWYSDCLRAAKDGALLFSFTDWRQLPCTTDAVQAGGWVWRGIIPWNKTEATRPQLGRPRAQCEYVVFATKGAHSGNELVIECPTSPERIHITEKPLKLMLQLMLIVVPGGVVLDPFCGSASTGVAALRSGRRAVLFELSDEIAGAAEKRMRAEEARRSKVVVRAAG